MFPGIVAHSDRVETGLEVRIDAAVKDMTVNFPLHEARHDQLMRTNPFLY
jgi:hypothetical protein